MLRRAGIDTLKQLKALGAVKAYVAVQQTGARCNKNLLWALQGALDDMHWIDVKDVQGDLLEKELKRHKSPSR